MKSQRYYALVTSLPHLPHFNQASRLPISRERLLERLKMLTPEDYKLIELVTAFIAWRRQPIGRTDAEMVALYQQGLEMIFESVHLKPLFEFSINQKTILAALRRLQKKLSPPSSKAAWGVGPLVPHIERNWDKPFFKLEHLYPWIIQVQAYLHKGEALKLEYLLFDLVWHQLDQQLFRNNFGFEAIVAYLLKWEILRQWLTYNKKDAQIRFETLVWETIHECEKYLQNGKSSCRAR